MKPHPHIDIITAWYNGATVQCLDGTDWIDLADYNPNSGEPSYLFRPTSQYRIKPEPPITIELTKEEAIVLYAMTRRVAGCPTTSIRKHTDSAGDKLRRFVPSALMRAIGPESKREIDSAFSDRMRAQWGVTP